MQKVYRVRVGWFFGQNEVIVTDPGDERELFRKSTPDPDEVPKLLLEFLAARGEEFRGTIPGTFRGEGERFYLVSAPVEVSDETRFVRGRMQRV